MAKILIVEDDKANCVMIARHLQLRGYQVSTASNGLDAIKQAQNELPDLVLMDMGLPVIDGWQATRRLKDTEKTRNIPIIALTAFAMLEDQERSRAVGCDDYETKPIEFPRLFNKIQVLLTAHKKQAE